VSSIGWKIVIDRDTNVAWYKWYVSKINEWHTRACIPNPNKKHYITQRLLRKVAILDIPDAKEKTTVGNNHSIIDKIILCCLYFINKTYDSRRKNKNVLDYPIWQTADSKDNI
jgi:hypothetical protein